MKRKRTSRKKSTPKKVSDYLSNEGYIVGEISRNDSHVRWVDQALAGRDISYILHKPEKGPGSRAGEIDGYFRVHHSMRDSMKGPWVIYKDTKTIEEAVQCSRENLILI